ncbi:MAG TPA: fibronectin type III domain-containing protein, partial [Rubrobacter sp.]|nr:fibronectin type III domain-containing protein [Rubrobacter sp.]
MAPELTLGPLLRYTGESDATVWVETDTTCEVEVLGHRASTFEIEGHHYTLVRITDLAPGKTYEYEVSLDGEKVWPDGEHDFPPCVIRTIAPDGALNLSYGSCRVSVPHESPFTLASDANKEGYERDALQALALRMMR